MPILEQNLNGLSYRLQAPFDFSFLEKYGTVFQVFDDQDSGNICFGATREGQKYFIKFAGARTARYEGDPADAVRQLQKAWEAAL